MKWHKISTILKYATAFLLPTIVVLMLIHFLDNDTWFLLTSGRYIAENGVYYTDVLSMHEGLEVTMQQYGFSVFFWWIYSAFGGVGLYVMMLGLNVIVMILLYKIFMIISKKNVNLSLFAMIIADVLLGIDFVRTRPQMVSYCIFLAVIYIMELYIKTDKSKYLWWIPLLSLLQINMHASVWWMIFIIMGTYFIDGIRMKKIRLQGYRKKPIAIVGLVALLVGFLNPYGLKMITYVFTSFGQSEISCMVDEMKPFNYAKDLNIVLYYTLLTSAALYMSGDDKCVKKRYIILFSIFAVFGLITVRSVVPVVMTILYLIIAAAMVVDLFRKGKDIRFRYNVLYLGFLLLGIIAIKGMSQFIMVMLLPVVLIYRRVRIEKVIDDAKARRALMVWSGIITISVAITMFIVVVGGVKSHPNYTMVTAIDALDARVEEKGEEKEKLKIYVCYNWGGYVEFRGYKAYLDPRAEIFLKVNNGKEDILKEWNDFRRGDIKTEDFLEKYDFDYLVVNSFDGEMSVMDRDDYRLLFQGDDLDIKVFEHVR